MLLEIPDNAVELIFTAINASVDRRLVAFSEKDKAELRLVAALLLDLLDDLAAGDDN